MQLSALARRCAPLALLGALAAAPSDDGPPASFERGVHPWLRPGDVRKVRRPTGPCPPPREDPPSLVDPPRGLGTFDVPTTKSGCEREHLVRRPGLERSELWRFTGPQSGSGPKGLNWRVSEVRPGGFVEAIDQDGDGLMDQEQYSDSLDGGVVTSILEEYVFPRGGGHAIWLNRTTRKAGNRCLDQRFRWRDGGWQHVLPEEARWAVDGGPDPEESSCTRCARY